MALFTTWQPIPTKTYSDVCRMATNTGTSYKLSLSFGNQHWNRVVVIFVTWQPAQASGEDSMGKQNSQAVEIHLLFFFLSEIDIFFSQFFEGSSSSSEASSMLSGSGCGALHVKSIHS